MAENRIETISLISFQVEGAQSVADLRSNISALKGIVNEAKIGTDEYKQALALLRENQNAVKDAAYAEKAGLEAVISSAKGATNSYNGLVNKMAELKREFRSTSDEARRMELGTEIKKVNDQLKEMDALQGNFQRNVGNYASAAQGFADTLKAFPPTLGKTSEGIKKVGTTLGLVGKQPVLAMVGLLAPVLLKIAGALKENDTALVSIEKVMKALEPVMNIVTGIVQKLAEYLSQAVDWFVSLGGEGGETFKKIIAGAVGVGNTILQFVLTPIRTTINAFKGLGNIIKDVFSGNFKQIKEDAADAFNGIKDAFTKGFSFKENFEMGQKVGEEFAAGLNSGKSKKAVQTAAKEIKDVVENTLMDVDLSKLDSFIDPAIKARMEAEKAAAAQEAEMLAFLTEQEQEAADEINAIWEEFSNEQLERLKDEEKMRQARIDMLFSVADATSSIFSSLADIYEEDAENNEAAAKQAKNLRIAGAVIDTISGAVGAYMQAVKSVPPPYGIILGAVQAAAVTASGYAQIAKIKSTNVSKTAAPNSPAPMAQAPVFAQSVPQTTILNSASDEVRLNQMASDKKVYLVVSELEAKQEDMKVQIQESTFQ